MRGQLITAERIQNGDVVRPAHCFAAKTDRPVWVRIEGVDVLGEHDVNNESLITLKGYIVYVGRPNPLPTLRPMTSRPIHPDTPYRILMKGSR